MKSSPNHCTPTTQKYGIRVGPDLFRLVSVLSCDDIKVGGRVQLGNLLLKTYHINT